MSTTSPPDRREMSRSSRSGWWWTWARDRKSTRLNSSHGYISYAAFCLKKKTDSLSDRVGGGVDRALEAARDVRDRVGDQPPTRHQPRHIRPPAELADPCNRQRSSVQV